MSVAVEYNGGTVILTPGGDLDTLSSGELGKAIAAIERADAIRLDLSRVEYTSSAGVRQFLAGHRRAKQLGASFCLVNVSDQVLSILKITGLDTKIDIAGAENA